MRHPTTTFLLLLLLFPQVVSGTAPWKSPEKPGLPVGIRKYLDQNYAGWRLTSIANGCGREFRGAFATGDFDGDGRRDYTVKFIRGRQGFIVAFLERRNGYEAHLLHGSMTVPQVRNTGISVFKKGERIPLGDPDDERYTTLVHDAPFDGPCESDAGGVHVYRNGIFTET